MVLVMQLETFAILHTFYIMFLQSEFNNKSSLVFSTNNSISRGRFILDEFE